MESGKFYIVGMGPHPDLVTLRALRTIQKADYILLKGEGEKTRWAEYIQDKPTWVCPAQTRIGLGVAPETVENPEVKSFLAANARLREETISRIRTAILEGKTVVALEAGDPLLYGTTFYLEELEDLPTEIIPGISSFQAACAAVKKSPTFGWDTSAVILTMDDWEGRLDRNEELMRHGSSFILFAIDPDYAKLFNDLKRHYPPETPIAIVAFAGDPENEKLYASTVGSCFEDIDFQRLPLGMYQLLVGKFLEVGQARKDALQGAERYLKRLRNE